MNKELICLDPFTLEEYEGELKESTCDACGDKCTYLDDAYGEVVLILCGDTHCKKEKKGE